MWEKILEILFKKYLDNITPKRKVAKSLIKLYKSMDSCHQLYHLYKKQPSHQLYFDWLEAVDKLYIDIGDIETTYRIFDPEGYLMVTGFSFQERILTEYEKKCREILKEERPQYFIDAKDRRKNFSELKLLIDFHQISYREEPRRKIKEGLNNNSNISLEKKQIKDVHVKDLPNDFESAINRLGQFIRDNFGLEDVS
jgi:hypothetical protein